MTENQHWSQAWLQTLHQLHLLGPRTATGAGNRIRRMEVTRGQVTAEVQQRASGLCQVRIQFTPLQEAAWQALLGLFQLQLAGTRLIEPHLLFATNEPTFSTLKSLLLPETATALQVTSSCCPEPQNLRNCAATQTVYRQLGTMLDEEPVLLLRLRGREWQQVIQALQQRPMSDYGAATSTTGAPSKLFPQSDSTTAGDTPADREDLATLLSSFWGSRKEMESFQHHIALPAIDLALLRRLGPLPEELGDATVDQLLATLYRLISRQAEALAYDLEPALGSANKQQQQLG